jgi:hypothetical protein
MGELLHAAEVTTRLGLTPDSTANGDRRVWLITSELTPKAGATGRKTFESAKAQKRLELATNRWPDPTPTNVT